MDDYISKPLSTEQIREVLSHWHTLRRNRGSQADRLPNEAPPLVDVTALMSRVNHEQPLLGELAVVFREDGDKLLGQAKDAIRRQDLLALARAAHELKGASLVVCATRMQALAGELERKARQAQSDELEPILEQTEAAFQGIVAELENLRHP
jgi:HPt (histidine-containing phosphotransfer) domain-containing protein